MNSKTHIVSKSKKVNKLWWELFQNTRLNLKPRFVSEKKKNIIMSEMSWCNVLQRQTQFFVQLISSKASLPFFVSWYLSKKELTRILILVRKIFNCKVPVSAFVSLPHNCWELWKQLISSNFQNATFKIITITVTKLVAIQVFFLLLLLNKRNKYENTEYHGKFITFKNQLYSKPGSPIFLFFG